MRNEITVTITDSINVPCKNCRQYNAKFNVLLRSHVSINLCPVCAKQFLEKLKESMLYNMEE